jgi:hypothetical protein
LTKGNPTNAFLFPDLSSAIAIAIVQGKMEEQSCGKCLQQKDYLGFAE